jgi:hypothetical protein
MAKTKGLTKRQDIIELLQENPDEQAYNDAYRRYHLTEGVTVPDVGHVQTSRQDLEKWERTVYDRMWG